MGNYYEGNITIGLKKDLPNNIKELLLCLSENKDISQEFKNEEYFKKERWDSPNFSFGYWINENNKGNIYPYDYFDDEDGKEEFLKVKDLITGYYVEIQFCIKGYNNHMESFLEFIRPYINLEAPNYLGVIEDEDGRYKKDFFIDNSIFNNEIENRKFLCDECEKFKETTLCDSWELCHRAYLKGVNSKEMLK